ncbi:MAG: ChbG/HpnK family deacetylase [Lachnospiraceae bacterium]|nr:ChbG/HpnK family deacetylase [Lachnospiraceae bacterium]
MGLILNADDFGKSEEVNRAIAECFRRGYIDRTTLMVNMPYAGEAVKLAQEEGFSDRVGIHLNLTEGMPLTRPIRKNPLFCDENGRFHAGFRQSFRNRIHMDKTSRQQIHTELKAQLDQYKAWGFTLFHADSHHHVHTDFPVYRVLKILAGEFSFSSIRLSRNLYHGGSVVNAVYKKWYNASVAKLCGHCGDCFGSAADLMGYGTASENRTLCRTKQVEIMLHPMYDENGRLMDTDMPMEQVFSYISQIHDQ